jgi:hypothetical protein
MVVNICNLSYVGSPERIVAKAGPRQKVKPYLKNN